MILILIATLAAGLFAGAAIYVSAVEHPARVSCGTELAIREFRPSYKRGAVMQVPLAIVGFLAGLGATWQLQDGSVALGAVLLGALIPFTLIAIFPTNTRLLDPALDPRGAEAAALLRTWGRLHAVRSALSTLSFVLFLMSAAK
jgi:hypothetical protein